MDGEGYVPIPEFYAGKSVFITGGSGYLGKVLIEKLLYSCPLLDNIYVLLRDKKSVKSDQRLRNMIELPIFSRLKTERPEFLNKIVLIQGDLTAPDLNMASEDLQTLKDKVSVVIHSAATVKFNEPLRDAMAINVEGTRNVLTLCHSLKNIQSFVYVSTAYSNCNRQVVEEVIYPSPASIDRVYKLIEDRDEGEDLTKILNGLPNTYTFSKALAEKLVVDIHGNIPTVIVRPSCVTPATEEPLPGWVDNWFGSTSLMAQLATGVCRTLNTQYNNNLDLIPVDYVCNLILVAAARVERSNKVSIPVYNSCTGSDNPISIGDAFSLYINAAYEDGFNVLPFPNLVLYTQKKWLITVIAAVMYVVAYVADILLKIFRKKQRFKKILNQSMMLQDAVGFFLSRSWLMKSPKAAALSKSLSPEDYRLFPCNPRDINWKEYFPLYYHGVKKYLIANMKKSSK